MTTQTPKPSMTAADYVPAIIDDAISWCTGSTSDRAFGRQLTDHVQQAMDATRTEQPSVSGDKLDFWKMRYEDAEESRIALATELAVLKATPLPPQAQSDGLRESHDELLNALYVVRAYKARFHPADQAIIEGAIDNADKLSATPLPPQAQSDGLRAALQLVKDTAMIYPETGHVDIPSYVLDAVRAALAMPAAEVKP